MVAGDEVFVFNQLHRELFGVVGLLRFQRMQLLAAAGNAGIGHRSDQIAAAGADMEMHLFQIAHRDRVGLQFAREQLFQFDIENARKIGQQRNIGAAEARFP